MIDFRRSAPYRQYVLMRTPGATSSVVPETYSVVVVSCAVIPGPWDLVTRLWDPPGDDSFGIDETRSTTVATNDDRCDDDHGYDGCDDKNTFLGPTS